MFISTSKTNTSETLYLVETVRTKEGRRTTRVVERLGTVDELRKEHEDPKAWAAQYAKERSKPAADGEEIHLSFNTAAKMGQGIRHNGGYLFLQALYHRLRLHQLCNAIQQKHSFRFNLNSILSRLVYGRILFPCSKRGTATRAVGLVEPPDFDLHQVCRALDILAEESDRIQAFVYRNSKDVCERRDRILYYDCTNYYTEAEEADGLRQYGRSKENRPNPIVEMGLFMDASGMPLPFSIWPGNTNEQVTMRPLEEKIIRDFRHVRFIVCTDSGLSSASNRLLNSHANRAFITTQSVKKLKKHLKDWALDEGGWKLDPQSDDTYDMDTILAEENRERFLDSVFHKERWFRQDKLEQRLIVSFSLRHMLYQRAIRDRQVERARKMIGDRSDSLKKKNAHDCRRFVKQVRFTSEGEVAQNEDYLIDEEVIAQEERHDGFHAVCTNLSDGVEEIIRINRGRWEIEECFRICKTLFGARPIHVWLDRHIEAHFLICFLALLLFRLLEQLVARKTGVECTTDALAETLREYQFCQMQGYWFPAFERSGLTDALESVFDLTTLSNEIITSRTMKENLRKTRQSGPLT